MFRVLSNNELLRFAIIEVHVVSISEYAPMTTFNLEISSSVKWSSILEHGSMTDVKYLENNDDSTIFH